MISKSRHQLSIALQTNKHQNDYKLLGKLVEDLNFDCLTVYNDLLYQPPWIPLVQLAQATTKIKLGVASVNPFTSHPINIASNIAMINEISNGRAYLGISRGSWLNFLGLNPEKPIDALHDAILVIKHFLKQSKDPFISEFFPLEGGDTLRWNIPKPDIPILLGSWGIKTIKKCQNLISDIKLGGTANPDLIPKYQQILQNKKVGITLGCVTVLDEDSDKAKELAKKEVALYLPVIAKLDSTLKIKDDVLMKISSKASKFDFKGAAEFIDDSLLKKFSFAGTADEIINQTLEIFNKGGTRVEYGTPHGLNSIEGIKLLGDQVLPFVKEKLGETIG